MKAADVMTLGAATVRPGDSVARAAQMMLQYGVSGLPVVDDDGRIVGMITERDFLRRAELGTERKRPRWAEFLFGTAELADDYVRSHARTVEEVMTRDVVTVEADTPLSKVVDIMERRDFKRLPVLRDGRLAGIISRANLLRAVARRPDEIPAAQVDDRVIRDRIIEEIEKQPWAPQGALDVNVRNGVVELRGTLADESVRRAVRVAAENVPGVQEVKDDIQIIQDLPGWV
jgi:CBS domain-containing protein